MPSSNSREIKMGEENDRASRMARQAEREQREKRRGKSGRDDRTASTPGASSVKTDSSASAERTERMRSRAEGEMEAKRRAREDGKQHASPRSPRSRKTSRSPHRSPRRTKEEQAAKRRARSGNSSSAATPGAQSYSTDSAPVSNNNNGALELQAELVNEEHIMDENQKLRQQMAEQNEMMRRQRENDNAAFRNELNGVADEDQEQHQKSFPRDYKIEIGILVIVAIAAGIGAFMATRGSTSSTPVVISNPTQPPSSILATPVPTTSPTVMQLYPKPSPQDCSRVAAGQPVQGQSRMESRRFDVKTDVSLVAETGLNRILKALQDQTQSILIPNLVGCNERRRLKAARQSTSAIKHRYAIANVEIVSVDHDESQTCSSTGDGPCYPVVTTLDLFLNQDSDSNTAANFILQSLVVGVYDVDGLAVDLGINLLIDFISFEDISQVIVTDPTNSPITTKPVPTPTIQPIPTPTLQPVSTTPPPTPGPTPKPTEQPVAPSTPPPAAPGNCAEANCQGENACSEVSGGRIGCGSCIGRSACERMDEVEIGEGSCTAVDSCASLIGVTIGSNSCLGRNSCICLGIGAEINDDECQYEGDCCGTGGIPKDVPSNSCGGTDSCRFASGPIGGNSCNDGTKTCFKSKASIEPNSCNGGGCGETLGEIASNACNGSGACPKLTIDMVIFDNSCNCDRCCACLEGTEFLEVPLDSCNTLAPNKGSVDFVNGEDGPFKHCCA